VVGANESLSRESFGSDVNNDFDDLLEYPQFTRPFKWRDKEVPRVLVSGHHKNILNWQKQESVELTKIRRFDLYQKYLMRNLFNNLSVKK
jgi:tRNA (guanine37-N1)-methyltransferase